MSGKIPNYDHPTIAEALCEIHFVAKGDGVLSDANYDRIRDALKDEYPNSTDQALQRYEAAIGPKGVSVVPVGTPSKKRVLKHGSRNSLIQINPQILSVNEVNEYPGWEKVFRPDILRALVAQRKSGNVEKISRIGLRYINRIPRGDGDNVGVWLSQNDYYPPGCLQHKNDFANRFEFRFDTNLRAIVILAEEKTGKGARPFIFDLDCIFEQELPINDDAKFNEALEKLHNLSWKIFGKSLTSRYEQYLNKGL